MTTIHDYRSLQNHQLPFTRRLQNHCENLNYHSPLQIANTQLQNHGYANRYSGKTLKKKQGKIQIKISKCSAKVSPPTKKEPGLTTHHQRNTRFNHPPSKEPGLTTYHQRNTYTHLRACTHTSIVMVTSARHLSRDLADKLTPEVCTSPSLPIHQQLFTYFHKIKSKDLHTPFSTANIVKYLRVRVTVS